MPSSRGRTGLPDGFDRSVFRARRYADEVATIIRGRFEPRERLNEPGQTGE